MISQCFIKDTSKLNTYFNDVEFMSNFSPDVKFVYGPSPLFYNTNSLMLLALKKKGIKVYIMDGDAITNVHPFIDENGLACVSISMNAKGTNIWKNMTGDNIGRSIAIVKDGYAKSWPTVNAEISNGRSVIRGDFTFNEVQDLANGFNSRRLPIKFRILDEVIQ